MNSKSSYPKCYNCGARVEAREDQAVVRFEGEDILFQRVPMGVCTGCGERFLTSKTARVMEHAVVLCHPVTELTAGEIRTLREGLRLSRDAFASKVGVSSQTVFRWETGRTRPARWARDRMEALRKKTAKKRRRTG